jgi:hypothetical protein
MTEKSKSQKNVPRGPFKLIVPPGVNPTYSNLVRLAHMPSEIVFDFGHMLPGERHARVVSRVLMSPMSAKLLHRALTETLTKYEAAHGEIKIPMKQSLADQLFRPFASPDDSPDDTKEE